MSLLTRAASLFRNTFHRQGRDHDLDAELGSYLDLLTHEKIAQGVSSQEARRQSLIELGGATQIKEQVRDVRASQLLESFWRDLRFTFRSLRRKPGFSAVVVLSLALGIGASTAIFCVVDALILRPLGVPHPREIIVIDTAASRLTRFGGSSYLDYVDFCKRTKSFYSLALAQQISAGLNPGGTSPDAQPQTVYGLLVSANFFSALEVQPALGRRFLPEEGEVPGKYPVAVISHSLWTRVFASDPRIAGRQVKMNGHNFTIVGVASKSFTGIDIFYRPDIFIPAMMSPYLTADGMQTLTERSYRAFTIYGRLQPGVSVAQAQAEMNVVMSDLEREHSESNKDAVAIVRRDMDRRLEGGLASLPALLGALVILVLVMACANVASLLLARATTRIREISTQIALGATRGCLIRQFLTESTVLAALGGASGILFAYAAICGFRALVPYSVAPDGPDFRIDLRVVACAVAASAVSVLLFGLAPAFTAVKEAWAAVMNTRSAVSANRSFSVVARRVLIGGQIALSAVLLIVGGLFLKSFGRAQQVDVGFNPSHMLVISLDPMLQGYSTPQAVRFQEQLLQRVVAIPGVEAASVAGTVPFLSGNSWDLSIDGYIAPDGERYIDTLTNQVGPKYFAAMQIPLLHGREFTALDTKKSLLVAIVNQSLAGAFVTADGDFRKSLGHIIRLRDGAPIQIVGVVKDSNTGGPLGQPARPVFYTAYSQMGNSQATLHVRTKGDPIALVGDIRRELSVLDPAIAPISVLTMTSVISSQALFVPRVIAILGGSFGIAALTLAVIGLYGVVSCMVGRRTQEIGIRMTLGAQRTTVLRMVLVNGLSLAGFGLLAGLALSAAAAPLLRTLLVGVSPWDPATFGMICAALLAATLVASYIPANRATQVDPMTALRHE